MNGSVAGSGSFNIIDPVVSQASLDQTIVTPYVDGQAAGGGAPLPTPSASYSRVVYTYDQYGLLLSRQEVGGGLAEVYTYDGLGRVMTATDSAGALTTTVYNDGGRAST